MPVLKQWTAIVLAALILFPCATALAEPESGEDCSCSVCIVGDLMCLDEQMKAAKQPDGSFDFRAPFIMIRERRTTDTEMPNHIDHRTDTDDDAGQRHKERVEAIGRCFAHQGQYQYGT